MSKHVTTTFPAHGPGAGDDQGTAVQRAIDLDIDENGSPVTLDPADWLVCFVPGLQRQWWHRFVPGWQHVFMIRPVNHEQWLLFEPWWTRLLISTLDTDKAVKFLRWADAGATLLVRERIPGTGSQLRGWSNCAVLATFLLGRSYWLLSPNTLYRRLKSEPEVREVKIPDILRRHFAHVVHSAADAALGPAELVAMAHGCDARELLVFLAQRIVDALRTPSLAMAYRVAASEAQTFPELADTLRERGTCRAVRCAEQVLARLEVECGGGARPPDAAQAFVAVVRDKASPLGKAGQSAGKPVDTRAVVDSFLARWAVAPRSM